MTWTPIADLKGLKGDTGPMNPEQASRFTAMESLLAEPGSRVENLVIDPIPVDAATSYQGGRVRIIQAPAWGRATATEVGAASFYPLASLNTSSPDRYFPAKAGDPIAARVILRGNPTQAIGATLVILGYKWTGAGWVTATVQPGVESAQVRVDPDARVTLEVAATAAANSDMTHFLPHIRFRRWGETYPQEGDFLFFREWAVQAGRGVALTTPVSYTDGTREGAYWTGAEHLSKSIQLTPRSGGGSGTAANQVLVGDFTYRRGGPKKIGKKTSVSFRIDHGLKNFDAKMRPKLESLGFKYALALGSRDWGAAENAGVTPSMVDGWVRGGRAEVWSHGPNHEDADTASKLRDYIVNSRAELERDIPSARVDGFMRPGVGGTQYLGFGPANTPEKFFGTLAGQLILSTYAVATGEMPGTAYRVQDGVPRVGQSYFNMDTFDAAAIISRVNTAIRDDRGIQLMIHPSLIDTAGYITTAQLHAALDQIKALETAGKVLVMSAYDQLLADSSPVPQMQLTQDPTNPRYYLIGG